MPGWAFKASVKHRPCLPVAQEARGADVGPAPNEPRLGRVGQRRQPAQAAPAVAGPILSSSHAQQL
eukprot:7283421-Pyramimonas_sp.AAC.1